MTQPPPQVPDYPAFSNPVPPRSNGLAVASMICSIAGFCVLFVGGLAGIILGLLALRKAREPGAGGRGMAVAGVVIGLLSFLTSFIGIGGVYYGCRAAMRASEPERLAARQFVQHLHGGDVAAAQTEATADLSPAEIQSLSAKLHGLGAFKDMTSNQINISDTNGVTTCTLHGTANFANGDQTYDITLMKVGGVWKVSSAQFP